MNRIHRVQMAPLELAPQVWTWPIPFHEDGRTPRISDGKKSGKKPGVRNHRGMDLMYRRPKCSKNRRPYGHPWRSKCYEIPKDVPTPALAAQRGRIILAGELDTGWVVFIAHAGKIGTAYHHLSSVLVESMEVVRAGQPIGVVGGSPIGYGLVHLHFDYVTNLNSGRSTLQRGKLKGNFQDAAKMMRSWRKLKYQDAWADLGRVGNDE